MDSNDRVSIDAGEIIIHEAFDSAKNSLCKITDPEARSSVYKSITATEEIWEQIHNEIEYHRKECDSRDNLSKAMKLLANLSHWAYVDLGDETGNKRDYICKTIGAAEKLIREVARHQDFDWDNGLEELSSQKVKDELQNELNRLGSEAYKARLEYNKQKDKLRKMAGAIDSYLYSTKYE